jgi:glucan biosynthesis protein C
MVATALLLHDWQAPAEMKFLVVGLGTFIVCLLTYHFWVRGSAIGQLLNGRRHKATKTLD